ncbi:N-acetyl-alpha-D-glucosaminyl L-malate synthase BshA [Pontibacter sp. G13]|uniref:N-acetyl-alpha-D-glucosaminyl L-malate synthase BshA n=1 Tax=Pontibacter sp. G13 TaxID=3074898 RepID=UPI00288BE77B|nr:N-acetyl-alpha-D-glucosaminyl L-malate synthase BshA [Pontibacter sp. G13]WNJ16619.1 N-acetyl-alpha-D-glucosaminyl L-malate synthase BshA [Pontibacter sp. G13]
MNIGIVCYPTYGGSGVVATELGKALAAKGHQIHFITYDRPIRLDLFSGNIFYHEVRTKDYPLFNFVPYESALASTMVDVARYHNLDLFHVHYAIPHASVAFLAKQILKDYDLHIPVVTTLHGTDITLVGKNPSYEPVVSFSIDQSDGVTAVSEYLKQATLENFAVRSDIRVIPNFVDLERFKRHDKEHFRKMLTSNGEKILIHTSNFRKVKRIGDVMKTFAKVRQEIPSKLLMVGDGPERNMAEELCREQGFCDDVVFLGNQNKVEEIYSIGDLFLLPSESESFGLAVLEAMACEVPVITTNAGGLPEVVVDGESGFVADVGDTDKMASDAVKILKDPVVWKKFSESAFKHAQTYSIERIVPKYEQYYEEVLGTVSTVS